MNIKIMSILSLLHLGCFSDPQDLGSSETGDETESGSSSGAESIATSPSTSPTSDTASTSSSASTTGTEETADADSSSESSSESSSGEAIEFGALSFDGDDEAVSSPTVDATLPSLFTVEVWINVQEAVDFYGVILDTRTDNLDEGWVLYVDRPVGSDPYHMIIGWGEGPVVGGSVAGLDPGWHHLAFSRDSQGYVRSFIDGALQTEEQKLASPTPQTSQVSVGRLLLLGSDTDYWWRGAPLDDLHISKTTRYTDNFVPTDPAADIDSVLLWCFSEGDGDVAVDEVAELALELGGPAWVEGR